MIKKLYSVLLAIVLAASLPACGHVKDAETESRETQDDRGQTTQAGADDSADPASERGQAATNSAAEAEKTEEQEIPEAPYTRDDGGISMDVFAMDTYMTLLAYGDNAEEAVLAAAEEIHRLDALLSTGSAESEVSRLNAAGGGEISDTVEELITRSQELRQETGGLFEIGIYPVMKLWGFPTQEFRVPEKAEIEEALKLADASQITISETPAEMPAPAPAEPAPETDPVKAAVESMMDAAKTAEEAEPAPESAPAADAQTQTAEDKPAEAPAAEAESAGAAEEPVKTAVFGIPGMEIDLGGIAKGYTSSRVMEIFREHGIKHGLVSLGGNVQTLGTKEGGKPWRVAIQDPESDLEYLGVLEIEDKCVITSGGYERYFEQDGVRYHHIIDPRTGYPAESGLLSATIISEDGTLADGLSTSLFIMGKDEAEKYWRAHPGTFDYILEDKTGTLYVTEGAAGLLTTDKKTVEIK